MKKEIINFKTVRNGKSSWPITVQLGTLSNDDHDGSENAAKKSEFAFFKT